jgi:hypothetical protein
MEMTGNIVIAQRYNIVIAIAYYVPSQEMG